MYTDFFGLKEPPFSIAPDPSYLYMSERHREALAHLVYGIGSHGGFVLLTGEVGTGKTTVCRCLLEQVPEKTEVAFIFNPKLTASELLATICDELGIVVSGERQSIKVLVDLINAHLLAAHARGCNTVLIIDEAQNLSTEVLEQLRLLTNLETNKDKLLQIILLGQPELHDKLARPELRQLVQRITARYYLGPLEQHEIADYVRHRISVAGSHDSLFDRTSITQLFRLSGGIPRLINVLCDRALLGAYALDQKRVNGPILAKAAREVFGEKRHTKRRSAGVLVWILAGLFLVAGAGLGGLYYTQSKKPAAQPASPGSGPMRTMESAAGKVTGASLAPAHMQRITADHSDTGQALAGNTAEKASMVPVTSLQWPDSEGIAASYFEAFSALFGEWDISFQPDFDRSACLFAKTRGLLCLHNKGSLRSLDYLNRPALLELRNSDGEQLYVVLTRLNQQTAQLFINGTSRTVDRKVLEQQWFGRFTLLWRTPPSYVDSIRPGMHGQAVEWLATQLSLIQGREPPMVRRAVYGHELEEYVKIYQKTQGLIPDGVVGAQTLIRLNTALGNRVPLLHPEQAED